MNRRPPSLSSPLTPTNACMIQNRPKAVKTPKKTEMKLRVEDRVTGSAPGHGSGLSRHLTAEFRVGGAIDHSHAARTELGGNPVMRNALAYHRAVPGLMGLS